MKAHHGLALAALAGAAVGAAAVTGLKAQGTPPAYYLSEVDVTDPATYKDYTPRARQTVEASGGRVLAVGGKIQAFDGAPPKRVVLIAFDSLAKVQAWRESPAFTALKPMRDRSATFRAYAVEGEAM